MRKRTTNKRTTNKRRAKAKTKTKTRVKTPRPSDMRPFKDTFIAGFQYYTGLPLLHDGDLKVGSQLRMIREPGNNHDPHAIRLFLGILPVGFIPKKDNLLLSHLLDRGIPARCTVTSVDPNEVTWRMVAISIEIDLGNAIIIPVDPEEARERNIDLEALYEGIDW